MIKLSREEQMLLEFKKVLGSHTIMDTDMFEKVEWLTQKLLSHSGPIFISPKLEAYPSEMIGNGTFALLDTGDKRILVTCHHVWQEFLDQQSTNPATVLGVTLGKGESVIAFKEPHRQLIDLNEELDLAVFEFDSARIHISHQKEWFKITSWPIPKVNSGSYVVTLGFPGAWRRTDGVRCRMDYVATPFKVSASGAVSFLATNEEENDQVLADMGGCWGGFSGSPVFSLLETGDLQLVGFTKLGPGDRASQSASATVAFSHAHFLTPQGMLRPITSSGFRKEVGDHG